MLTQWIFMAQIEHFHEENVKYQKREAKRL